MKKNLKRGEKSRGEKKCFRRHWKKGPKKSARREKCFRRHWKESPQKKRERGSGFDRHRYASILAGHKPGSRGSFFGQRLNYIPPRKLLWACYFFLQFFYFTLRKHFYIIVIKYFFCRSNISTADNHKGSV